MVLIQPPCFLGSEHGLVDELGLYRAPDTINISLCCKTRELDLHRNVLKAEETLVSEIIRRIDFPHQHDVLDPDTEAAVGVVSWLVGDSHPGLQGSRVVC